MNIYFLIAGILFFVLGLAHSILGEYLIFRYRRNKGSIVPTKVSEGLKGGHLRIIWATWHVASVVGWCVGALVTKIAVEQSKLDVEFVDFAVKAIVVTAFASSLLVLIGTKGKHPGWVVLLLISILLVIGK
ncbi:MAG: hypothetical protein AAFX87_03905 [Bacteroidota bacterium]